MSDDSNERARIAYEAFRGGLIWGLDPEVPRWEDAPSWIRDVALVAYLQGKLDAPSQASKPPYPFCRTPEKCAGKGYCPADIACND